VLARAKKAVGGDRTANNGREDQNSGQLAGHVEVTSGTPDVFLNLLSPFPRRR
jgi:hypothetical protein